jgi:catechol 2,3-dioxygenase-like lactoylglutathione lyase family enzyme
MTDTTWCPTQAKYARTRGGHGDGTDLVRPVRRAVTLGHAVLITPDLDRTRRFYEDVVGLRTAIIDHARGGVRRSAWLVDGSGVPSLRLSEVPGFVAGVADDLVGRRGRIDQLVFTVATEADLRSTAARLVDAGASSGEVADVGPTLSVEFVDPDGGHHAVCTHRDRWTPPDSVEIADHEAVADLVTHLPAQPHQSTTHSRSTP